MFYFTAAELLQSQLLSPCIAASDLSSIRSVQYQESTEMKIQVAEVVTLNAKCVKFPGNRRHVAFAM